MQPPVPPQMTAPVLSATTGSQVVSWTYTRTNPDSWKAYYSVNAGVSWFERLSVAGSLRTANIGAFFPLVRVVGLNASGIPTTLPSNSVAMSA